MTGIDYHEFFMTGIDYNGFSYDRHRNIKENLEV